MRSFTHVSLCLLLTFLCCTVFHTVLRPPSSSSVTASPHHPSSPPSAADPVTAGVAAATAAPQRTAPPPTYLPPPAAVYGGPPPLSDAAAAFEGGWWRRGPVTTKRSAVTSGGARVAAEVEYYEDTCVGRLLVRPAGAGEAAACPAPARLSADERWDGYLRAAAGPHYFRLRVEGGAELFAAAVPHVGGCRYAVHFRLLRPQASVALDVKWETDGYNGVTEAVDTIRSFRDKYVARGLRVGRCVLAASSTAAAPPDAAGTAGRYVRATAADHPVGFPAGAQVKAGEWLWQPAAAVAAAAPPPPPSCREARSGARILFVGDSQVRTVWRTWEAVLEGRPPTTQKAWRDVRSYGANHTVGFEFRPLLSNVTAALLQGYDHVVMGFGAWPANSGWTHAVYARFVRRLLAEVAAGAAGGPRVVWVGAPAWPKPRHNSQGFRITNARLRMWNEVSFAKAREVGLRTVDFFGVSAPHMKLHRGDGMHYDHSVVLYSMVEEIARLTCLPTP